MADARRDGGDEDSSGNGTAALPSVVVPGPELRARVDNFAARLSGLDKRKADEMVAKVLASNKRNQFLFVDASHIFYPYFLSRLSEYRGHPELRPDKVATGGGGKSDDKKSGSAATTTDGSASAPTTTTTTTTMRNGTVLLTSGGTANAASEELLRQAEQDARQYLQDPYPHVYSLDLRGGTIDMPALVMDVMECTAQFAAKYGDAFVQTVLTKHRHNPLFRFLHTDDVRNEVFGGLVSAYTRILRDSDAATEVRLEALTSRDHVLTTVCAAKAKYAKAALARRKAALLTDDELRAKLQWASFKVVRTFTLADVSLDGPLPEAALAAAAAATTATAATTARTPVDTALQSSGSVRAPLANTLLPPSGMPVYTPMFMSASLVHASDPTADSDTHTGSKRQRKSSSSRSSTL